MKDTARTDTGITGPVCPVCAHPVPGSASRCPHCGAPILDTDTVTHIEAFDSRLPRHSSLEDARFPPGRIFAARYRIVSLLGRGGMGEVYRADDLKLGQRVALKLLAVRADAQSEILHRFVAEVRLARDISHPNVCRVYDIGEAEGWHYLSMEYVDGETLASLLRRFGNLPGEKALDFARQLCAGLAAAHERGVLHRDLKPANIMVDGRGQIRIVDLGLATPAGDPVREVAGTPAYMAPEQLSGGRINERTDVYALGLVLYELFTGRMVFPVSTLEERVVAGSAGPVAIGRMSGVDPDLEDAIRSCLEVDPFDRPSSAWAVAAALPGGDPLAAALAEGRMPSPEMIAAAGQKGALRRRAAWSLAGAIAVGTLAVAARVGVVTQTGPAHLPKPLEVLAERARNELTAIGHTAPVKDDEFWFEPVPAGSVADTPSIRFVYRQSPEYLISQNSLHVVIEHDPPADTPGMATVVLDADGRLRRVSVVPQARGADATASTRSWPDLFADAGLDFQRFVPAAATPSPLIAHDSHVAWEGPAASGATRLRVTGASLNQQIVFFDVAAVGAPPPARQTWYSRGARSPGNEALLVAATVLLFIGGGILAQRNLRLGYGDTRGARRLCRLIAVGGILWGVLRAHHVPQPVDEWMFLLIIAGWSLVWAGFAWVIYISLEPYMRKWWPHTLISWARLLAGRARDPLVGRDVLVGLLAGVVFVALLILRVEIYSRFGVPVRPLDQWYSLEAVRSIRYFLGLVIYFSLDTLNFALGALGTLLLLRVAVRSMWLSAAIWMVIVASLNLGGGGLAWDLPFGLALAGLVLAVLLRSGLVSAAVMLLYIDFMTRLPVTLDAGSWYIAMSVLTLALVGAMTMYGFVVALAGQRPFVSS